MNGPPRESRDSRDGESSAGSQRQKKTQMWHRIKTKAKQWQFTRTTFISMFKTSIPPTVAVCLFQSTSFANHFGTLGYLIAFMAASSMPGLPRAKHVDGLFKLCIATALGGACCLLAGWAGLRARDNTTLPGPQRSQYSSSASAVVAIFFLFFNFLAFTIKSMYPDLRMPAIIFAIFCSASLFGVAQTPNMDSIINSIDLLLEGFFLGFGLGLLTNLLIFPTSSRHVFAQDMVGFLGAVDKALNAQKNYFESFEDTGDISDTERTKEATSDEDAQPKALESKPEAVELKAALNSTFAAMAKLKADLPFAQRELAWGKLDPEVLDAITKLFGNLISPLAGLISIMNLVEALAKQQSTIVPDQGIIVGGLLFTDEWKKVLDSLDSPFHVIIEAMSDAIEHVKLSFELDSLCQAISLHKRRPSRAVQDVESVRLNSPGTRGFAQTYRKHIEEFRESRIVSLNQWAEQKGLKLPTDTQTHFDWRECMYSELEKDQTRRMLFLLLYLETLLSSLSKELEAIVNFVDSKVEDGTMSRNHLIFPRSRHLRKWWNTFHDSGDDSGAREIGEQSIHLGEAFYNRKDAEHLPPNNTYERLSGHLRLIPKCLSSRHCSHGFRAMCAVMTIGIVGFLHDTHEFFTAQRFNWAIFAISLSISPSSGLAFFSYWARFVGTFCAMITSYVFWYMVDGKTAGVLVMLWLGFLVIGYLNARWPQWTGVYFVANFALIVMNSNELQDRKLGEATVRAKGQVVYPPYELFPYRLAIVSLGIVVAMFWTLFPFPLDEFSEFRKELASAILVAAKYHSVAMETIRVRFTGLEKDPTKKHDPGYHLSKMRSKLVSAFFKIITRAKINSQFVKWQIPIGGRFPSEAYNEMIVLIQRIFNYMTLISYASSSVHDQTEAHNTEWFANFQRVLLAIEPTSETVSRFLMMLCQSLGLGHPLPPHIKPLEPYDMIKRLEQLDEHILDTQNMTEPGYAALATIQISARAMILDINSLFDIIKSLVGELDFSSHFDSGILSEITSKAPSTANGKDGINTSSSTTQTSRSEEKTDVGDKMD